MGFLISRKSTPLVNFLIICNWLVCTYHFNTIYGQIQFKRTKKRLDSSILASLLQYLHVSEIVEIPHIVHQILILCIHKLYTSTLTILKYYVGTIENIFYIKNELFIPVVSSSLFFIRILCLFPNFSTFTVWGLYGLSKLESWEYNTWSNYFWKDAM